MFASHTCTNIKESCSADEWSARGKKSEASRTLILHVCSIVCLFSTVTCSSAQSDVASDNFNLLLRAAQNKRAARLGFWINKRQCEMHEKRASRCNAHVGKKRESSSSPVRKRQMLFSPSPRLLMREYAGGNRRGDARPVIQIVRRLPCSRFLHSRGGCQILKILHTQRACVRTKREKSTFPNVYLMFLTSSED